MQLREQRVRGPVRRRLSRRLGAGAGLCLSVALAAGLAGCAKNAGAAGPDATLRDLEKIPLPDLGGAAPADRRLPLIVVQRMDLPLDQPLGDAWTQIDEQAFPAITRGAWQANGLRLGVLHEQDVTAFVERVPEVLGFFERKVVTRSHPVAVMRAAPLRPDTRFAVDLTLPPRPAAEEVVRGREGGQLQLLARLEQDNQRWFLVLIPHLYRPKPNDFSSRTLLERDLDGRVFYELAVRVEMKPDRLVAVGLYWPWPEREGGGEAPEPAEDAGPVDATPNEAGQAVADTQGRQEINELDSVLASSDEPPADDPAAPPQRVRTAPRPAPREQPGQAPAAEDRQAMPPLPMHFGRVLLTGIRARRPVQTMLLISMPPVAGEAGENAEAKPAPTPPSE